MANETNRLIKVGVLVAASLATAMAFLFFIGSEDKTFSKKSDYTVLLESASGLAEGNPVQMAGVNVGTVKEIHLPRNPTQRQVTIVISVQKKYAERVRTDSRAKLRKLGLIASDSYIDVSLGSSDKPILAAGSVIPSARSANVDALMASGEDLVDNFVQITASLKNVLQRVDQGEGLLGELTTNPNSRQRITDTFLTTLNKTNTVLDDVRGGRGLVGKLIYDERYAGELAASIQQSALSMQSILGTVQSGFETGDGAVSALLTDPRGKRDLLAVMENLRVTSENMAALTSGMKTGEGLVPRLMNDKEYADQTLAEFSGLVGRLNDTARKLGEGEGTAGRLLADPSIYESINDILIGINESKLLRWLVRNRQQKGIETRYDATQGGKPLNAPTPPAPDAPAAPQVVRPPGSGAMATPPVESAPAAEPVIADPPPSASGVADEEALRELANALAAEDGKAPPPPL